MGSTRHFWPHSSDKAERCQRLLRPVFKHRVYTAHGDISFIINYPNADVKSG